MIRLYRQSDYQTISRWDREGVVPPADIFSEDSTFVLEKNGEPVATLTAVPTALPGLSFVEGLAAAPWYQDFDRKREIERLFDHAFAFLKARGFSRTIFLSPHPKLTERYVDIGSRLGFHRTLDELTGFLKEH